jgi:heme/copper-type cytochrome/quinol oxidase subunit 2
VVPSFTSTRPVSPVTFPRAPAGNVRTITLAVARGKVTGDTGRVDVKLGTTVDVAVTADVAQEVHIHGYDLHVDTVPGQTVHKQFVANIPGVFTIELEQTSTTLTRLQVQ